MIKNGEMDTAQLEVTQTARNNRVHERRNVQIKKKLMESVYNEPPPKHSFTSHVCLFLVRFTFLNLLIIFFSLINSFSKKQWMTRP